ncbi:MAG TPA: ATPase domain-containing protein [Thermoanaerobaculia bacterium]|jgi:circadian clock protein KaiC|nr:ATPase domain-containing protein [Thermoanaerobaculia bacterium]
MTRKDFKEFPRAATGVEGLDDILGGGFPINRMYLLEGDPGAGKTTLALQFLLTGVGLGEPGVYATLSETEEELRDVAASHGWSLDGITICELQTAEESLKADSQYTLFHPSEVELSETTRAVLETVERVRPMRIVFDSLSEMRLLARDSLRYRRQILALKHYFRGQSCTVLLLDYADATTGDFQLQSLTHGVISLEQLAPGYGGQRRRLRVKKIRGISFRDGYHDYAVRTGGLQVFPRLVAADHSHKHPSKPLESGLPQLDTIVGGGLDHGSSVMLIGPSGVGKSTLAAQYVSAAARRGDRAVVYTFDESPDTWIGRAERLGLDLQQPLAEERITVRQVDPAELSPGEFAEQVRRSVKGGACVVVIDSLNGYQHAMSDEHFLVLHLHELLSHLSQQGVLTILVMAQAGILGETIQSPVDLSYLADTVFLLRYFEAFGEVRKALSVVKRRTGSHERNVRELRLVDDRLFVGRELREFQGVLTGRLEYMGDVEPLMRGDVQDLVEVGEAVKGGVLA